MFFFFCFFSSFCYFTVHSVALPYIHAKMYLNQNRFKSILTIVNFWSMFSKRKQNILQKSSREILCSLAETLGHRLIEIPFFKKKIKRIFYKFKQRLNNNLFIPCHDSLCSVP